MNSAAVSNCVFVFLCYWGVYLQGEVLELALLDQKVASHVVLLDVAKFLSERIAPVFIPTSNKSACFPSFTERGPFGLVLILPARDSQIIF